MSMSSSQNPQWKFFGMYIFGLVSGILLISTIGMIIIATLPTADVPACLPKDYLDDPTEALRYGYSLERHLWVSNGLLFYERIPKTVQCKSDPTAAIIIVSWPQWCTFLDLETGIKRAAHLRDSGQYYYENMTASKPVGTRENCVPFSKTLLGEPLTKWLIVT